MEREQKRMLALGILISLVVVSSVIYFFWGSLINRGTLSLVGDPPFTVKFFNDETFDCAKSPCNLRTKSGRHDLIIEKSDFKTLVTETYVKLWSTTELAVNFSIIPKLEKIESYEILEEKFGYRLVNEATGKMQKLININDPKETALALFPNSFKNPEIFYGKKSILIIDQKQNYFINLKNRKKQKIEDPNLKNIKTAKWSPNGNYLVFSKNKSEKLWLFNTDSLIVEQLSLNIIIESVTWNNDNNLIFATDQIFANDSPAEEKEIGTFTFGTYDPEKRTYEQIISFTEIKNSPKNLLLTTNGQYLYFTDEDESYRIILKI